MADKEAVNELAPTTGMSRAEKVMTVLILVIIAAVFVPVCVTLSYRARLRINRVNLRDVRFEAIMSVQANLTNLDANGRNINAGLTEGAGWVACAYVDHDNVIRELRLFVVDDISEYADGIIAGRVESPVLPDDDRFCPEVSGDWTFEPFARVKPERDGVYTVQAALDWRKIDILLQGAEE